MRFADQTRKEFIDHLNHFVHPSEEISEPDQLVGRDVPLKSLRDSFETNGSHAFVWGLRGVGKTSLVHTACEKYGETVTLAAAIGCRGQSSSGELLDDIFRRVVQSGKVDIKDKKWKARLGLFGLSIENESGGFRNRLDIKSVNHASDFLNTILPPDFINRKVWLIIIDEFDQLENKETIDFFTALAKQMSVDKVSVKFAFCGVASSLNSLIGSHESVDRYIKAIELNPLSAGKIISITRNIAEEFEIKLNRGQETRIALISCGYPHFAHVIMKEILNAAFEAESKQMKISAKIFKSGVQRVASDAATGLHSAYESATKKSTDKYIEVLWAVADGQLLTKQFKSIKDDYERIMTERPDRERISNEQNLRNHLNTLCGDDEPVLIREKTGWYKFCDPMLRSYVRLKAHNDGIDLGDESFNN